MKIRPVDAAFYSGQDRHTHTQTDRQTDTDGNPRSGDGSQNLCQTIMVHNVVLYSLGGAKRSSHKHRQTDRQTENDAQETTLY